MGKTTRAIAIVGPTSSGKTELGIRIARRVGGEVISADSRQVYRGLDLGTGKVTETEMQGVPHHLIDVADPRERFTAHDFVRLGRFAIEDITSRGNIPIVVGGSGLYVDALLGRMPLTVPPPDRAVRRQLAKSSLHELQEKLKQLDPERYAHIDVQNPRRVQRAIEIVLSKVRPNPLFEIRSQTVTWIGLAPDREVLQKKIHERLRTRMRAGMLDEVRRLYADGLSYERMDELGLEYRYLARHLKGELAYDEMLEKLESEINQYAKRQMTWFRRNPLICWLNPLEAPPLPDILEILNSHPRSDR